MAPRFSGLNKLVVFEDWQKIQDSFSDTFGLPLSTVDLNRTLLFKKSNPVVLCEPGIPDLPGYLQFNGNWLLKKECNLSSKGLSSAKGLFNLETFFFPIKTFGQNVVAFMVIGPVAIDKREDSSFYLKCAEDLKINPGALSDSIMKVNVFSRDRILSLIALVEVVFTYIARTGYHKKRLGEISKEIVELDPLFSKSYEQKVLESLLNVCKIALDAESGSVMTIDKLKYLHITASSSLNKDIVNSSHQKVGEGIAGKAIATSESILLPNDSGKEGISREMKRRDIKSSMVIPFNKANSHEAYGVVNLNIMRKNRKFSEKDINLAKELVNLASIALSSVK